MNEYYKSFDLEPCEVDLQIAARIGGYEKVVVTKITFPCTRSAFALALAEASFCMTEELVFKAGMQFEREKELDIEN